MDAVRHPSFVALRVVSLGLICYSDREVIEEEVAVGVIRNIRHANAEIAIGEVTR